MIAPNKTVPLRSSALSASTVILACGPGPIDLARLYREVASEFQSADDFLLALDVLFVLGRISIDMRTRLVTYAQ